MRIPQQFKQILEKDQRMAGIVMYTAAEYSKILEENKLYFFEEYTDHGIQHIQSVLDFSACLIKEETYGFLERSPQSVGLYILAVILHDLGMHLTNEGLHALLSGRNDDIRIGELDDRTWKEEWEEFLDEARRFGDR